MLSVVHITAQHGSETAFRTVLDKEVEETSDFLILNHFSTGRSNKKVLEVAVVEFCFIILKTDVLECVDWQTLVEDIAHADKNHMRLF